jgi:hypothetical protein
MTMNVTQAKGKIDNKLSATFECNATVKQGDGLSAVLFIVELHSAIKDIDQRGTSYTKSCKICAYAEDVVIIAIYRETIIEICKEMEYRA